MNKKVFIITFFFVLILLVVYPKGKNNNVNIIKKEYREGINQTASDYLISKANGENINNYVDGDTKEMYTFSHDATDQTEVLTDYRYIGATPNNYVYFNCTDENDTSTCELWRIIGVFTVENERGEKEQRIKIVSNKSIGEYEWNENINNNWNESTLKDYLNNNYYNTLFDLSKEMINQTKFYLGGSQNQDLKGGSNYYKMERSKEVPESNPFYWIGKIGLMYPSDQFFTYAYNVDQMCFDNYCVPWRDGNPDLGWIYNSNINEENNIIDHWFISPSFLRSSYVYFSGDYGEISYLGSYSTSDGEVINQYGVRPVTYLKSNIYISEGNGSKQSPYKLSLTINDDNLDNNIEEDKADFNCIKKYKKESVTKYKIYQIGDEIEFKGDKYYVIKNSGDDVNYVTLLKDEYLTFKDLLGYKEEDTSIGKSYYFVSDTCKYYHSDNGDYTISSGCISDYNQSIVKQIVDNWATYELSADDLIKVDGYSARLVNESDLLNIGYFRDEEWIGYMEISYLINNKIDWFSKYKFFTMIPDSNSNIFVANSYDSYSVFSESMINNSLPIRPIINLKKAVLGNNQLYYVGDKVTYKNDDYYVIEDSDLNKDYVVLLKDIPLSQIQIDYFKDVDSQYLTKYYKSDTCDSISNSSGCTSDYSKSIISKKVDFWTSKTFSDNDLIEIDGYKSRLLTVSELFSSLGYSPGDVVTDYVYKLTEDVPSWIYDKRISYWTMSGVYDSSSVYTVLDSGNVSGNFPYIPYVYNSYAIRPVINLNKCVLDGGCFEEEIQVDDGCIDTNDTVIEKDNKTIVNVENTLKVLSIILLIISILLVVGGSLFIGYNYIKSRRERKL